MLNNITSHNIAAVIFFAVGLLTCLAGPVAAAEMQNGIEITVLSSRPDMVSGDDALIQVDVSADVPLSDVHITVNNTDKKSAFHANFEQNRFIGLIDELEPGANELSISTNSNVPAVTLMLINHPNEGPIFSGPHEQPFICETEKFKLTSGGTLGPPIDKNCSVLRRVDYIYRSVNSVGFQSLADPSIVPKDAAFVTTLTGAVVPYIVRVETGTINRAIYQIAVLHTPDINNPNPTAWNPPAAWNRRLIYAFGGGCVNGWYRQGAKTGGVTDDTMLRQGYAVASSSLNVYGNNCNDLLAAETMMMTKERFIEAYGIPLYTIGWGCSGGAYQNYQIADNYPGLLDGIIPGCSFPDVGFGTIPMITDARLLYRYFRETSTVTFTEDEQQAVAGFLTLATMKNVSHKAGRIHTGEFCPNVLPRHLQYHRTGNPDGARCDVYSHYVNVYGRDEKTGYVRRPLDNIGVQYGLKTLNDGVITPAQFLDLNRLVGGYNPEGNFQKERTEADLDAVRLAYETGRLLSGSGGLAFTPIIDYRAYTDDLEQGDVHVRYHSFSIRDRLRKALGRTDHHIMLVEDDRYGLYSSQSPVLRDSLAQMDRWLTNLAADQSDDSQYEKLVRAKPANLVDSCWSRDEIPERIVEQQVRGSGQCEALYPSASSPREVAGAPIAHDVIKCQLKPVDMSDYTAKFSTEQEIELREIFASGVCDWTKPGVAQTSLKATWLRF